MRYADTPRGIRFLNLLCAVIMIHLIICLPAPAAQNPPRSSQTELERAKELLRQSKHADALLLLEKLAAENPSDPEITYHLAFTRYIVARSMTDAAARRNARLKARDAALRARDLGSRDALIDAILSEIPPDGSDTIKFSKVPQAEAAMNEGETAFARGDLDRAIEAYERALKADPTLYEAALYIGDMYFKKGYRMPDGAEKNALLARADQDLAQDYPEYRKNNREKLRRYVRQYIMSPDN
jgi:tetratricopeptide (TPR) repeat protein